MSDEPLSEMFRKYEYNLKSPKNDLEIFNRLPKIFIEVCKIRFEIFLR